MAIAISNSELRSGRIGIRTTPAQEHLLRCAAATSHKSLTDFILDSACRTAEETLLDQRFFGVSSEVGAKILELLDAPAIETEGLRRLRDQKSPWEE